MRNEETENIKIADLHGGMKKIPSITTSVKSIHPNGLQTNARNRLYLPFTICDETGQTKCTAWEELAKPMSKILEVGQMLKIMNGDVEKIKGNLGASYTSEFQITLGSYASVEIHTADGGIRVIRARDNRPVPSFKAAASVPQTVATKGDGKIKVADLTRPGSFAGQCIELKVLKIGNPKTSGTGKPYFSLLGSDDTGDITCSLFDKHYDGIDHIQPGASLQLTGFNVLNGNKEPGWCQNDLQIHVYQHCVLELLSRRVEEPVQLSDSIVQEDVEPMEENPPAPVDVVRNAPVSVEVSTTGSLLADILKNTAHQKLGLKQNSLVGCYAVISDIEMDTFTQMGQKVACVITITDESKVPAQIIIQDPNDVPCNLDVGSIVVCQSLVVQYDDEGWELVFHPEHSSIREVTDDDIEPEKKKRNSWGTSADRFL